MPTQQTPHYTFYYSAVDGLIALTERGARYHAVWKNAHGHTITGCGRAVFRTMPAAEVPADVERCRSCWPSEVPA